VGVGVPPTVTVTESVCDVVTLDEAGITVTVGVPFCAVNPVVPEVLKL
jgi:hypothetical protein